MSRTTAMHEREVEREGGGREGGREGERIKA